jgi:hypothetical protein
MLYCFEVNALRQKSKLGTQLMPNKSFFVVIISLSCQNLIADDVIPDAFKKQMTRMVGAWVFSGNEGDWRFSGKESVRIVNDGTALLQEGYFDLDDGKKEHYVILSGWDGEKKTMLVRGFTSLGNTFVGEWKTVKNGAFVGNAQGKPAKFGVSDQTMTYEEDGGKWISKFERVK